MEQSSYHNCINSISDYLTEKGWGWNGAASPNFGFWSDPLTGQEYRSDHAFTIQTDRDVWEEFLRKDWLCFIAKNAE